MDADKEILTTTEAARILGVSVRTAQLLIEGGSIPSWKTPGGHRRVYRRDVLAMVPDAGGPPAPLSARVVLLAAPERLAAFEAALSGVPAAVVESHVDPYRAILAIGARAPAAVVIDADPPGPATSALIESLSADPALRAAQLFVVGAEAPAMAAGRTHLVPGLAALPAAVEAALRQDAAPLPATDEARSFPIPANEGQRLLALERLGIVDTPPEEPFDRLTWLASRALDAPVSLLGLLTPDRQVFKSRQGLDMTETPRDWAFCNYTILGKGVTVTEDLSADPRFATNPAVASEPHFRFYAGAPVVDPDGFPVGTLCVIDTRTRRLDEPQQQILANLAALASDQIRLRANDRQLRWALSALERKAS